MDMLDSESGPSPQHGYAEMLKEFGKLIDDMDRCTGEINVLKHEIEQVKERKRLEMFPDDETIEKYDNSIKALKEAHSYIKEELSIHELRAAEIRMVLYGLKPRYA